MLFLNSILLVFVLNFRASTTIPYSCDSPIYCYGELLNLVQMSEVFEDSKTFVDKKMITDEDTILANFKILMDNSSNKPSRDQLIEFVNNNFENGTELEPWIPPDFKPNPPILSQITDGRIKNFTEKLIAIWPLLTRKMKSDVFINRKQYSIIPVKEGFIIPGGRFREFYYWDSYWVIQGLIVSEMFGTIEGILDNFISIVQEFGFVPNGGRVYYLERSQPPLLTPMVANYFKAHKNDTWLRANIKTLEKELNYWYKNKTIKVRKGLFTYTMARYMPESLGPRPESFREDVQTASAFTSEERKQEAYVDLKGGAESGWDFSTRWLFDQYGGIDSNLTNIHTRRVIPVDLNSFLYRAFKDLSFLFFSVGNLRDSVLWQTRADAMKLAIQAVLYNQKDQIWYDYDLYLGKHRRHFAISNLTPLWAKAFNTEDKNMGDKILDYLEKENVFQYEGGTPTTLERSGEQWDFPNAWAPLQDIMVRGLHNTRNSRAQDRAKELALRWIDANIIGFDDTGAMFEKYDAVTPGQYGGGGEYQVQSGFGWTNGVALSFIKKYYT